MTEVLLLVVALLLTLACGVFVAAEFSLTTVERGDLERAVGARRARRRQRACSAVRTPHLPALRRPARHHRHRPGHRHARQAVDRQAARRPAAGRRACRRPAASSLALVLGTAAVHRRPDGRRRARARRTGRSPARCPSPRRSPPRSAPSPPPSGPLIRHLNNTANRILRRMGLEPDRGTGLGPRPAGAGGAGPALRQGGRAGGRHRRAVRPHAQPRRPDRGERDDAAGAGHRARRAGHRRGRRQRDPRDRPVPLPGLPRQPGRGRRHRAHQGRAGRPGRADRPRCPVTELLREPAAGARVADRGPAAGPALGGTRPWPWSSTSTAARPAW